MTLAARLAAMLGADHVLTDAGSMAPYLTDWRGRYRGTACCVVRPGDAGQVADVVGLCAGAGVPIVPQGGNTGLCGGATPDAGGRAVLLSLARLNRVRALDAANRTITAEAGCVLARVQEAARAAGLLFPLSLAAEGSATLGGNLSTNAGGVQVLRYGNTRELTLGLEVVLPDGRLWNGLRGLYKNNTGYDLKHWFIGAEGTLGVITAATMRLFPEPTARATAWVALSDAAAAVALLGQLQTAFGAQLTACELVSEVSLALVLAHFPDSVRPLPAAPWYVLFELSGGGDDAGLDAQAESFLAARLADGSLTDAVLARSLAQAEALWALRERISEAQKREGLSIKHDIAVPISRIPEFLDRAGAALGARWPGIRVVAFGHVGDGNLHYNLSLPAAGDNAELIAGQGDVNRIVHDLVDTLGGSISAEHGIGQLKRGELPRYKAPLELELMRGLKQLLDPRGLMNPGKVLDA